MSFQLMSIFIIRTADSRESLDVFRKSSHTYFQPPAAGFRPQLLDSSSWKVLDLVASPRCYFQLLL
eukprot:COSAG01_NODE_1049_length_11922_cov_10.559587_11_plen_66_part_00